jgi:folate-dependent phosphoribosylglycinamide formyltransferase PurN
MKKIVILASDTLHRRYFIKKIISAGIPIQRIIFETEMIQPNFPVGPPYGDKEKAFEEEYFFEHFSSDLEDLPVSYVRNINDDACADLLTAIRPDIGIVFGTRKIATKICDHFSEVLINVHRGIAQEYRGLDTNLWALYHMDPENIGVTIHKICNELDTGDIFYESRMDLPAGMKIYQMRYYETVLATDLMIKCINDHLNNEAKSFPQQKKGRYYSFMPLVIKQGLTQKLEKLLSAVYA